MEGCRFSVNCEEFIIFLWFEKKDEVLHIITNHCNRITNLALKVRLFSLNMSYDSPVFIINIYIPCIREIKIHYTVT